MIAQTKMHQRSGNELLLREQAGTYFHLSSNTEGVDALVACGLPCSRTDHLPVIVFGPMIGCFDGFSPGGNSKEIKASFAGKIGGIEHQCRDGFIEQGKGAFLIAQPYQCSLSS